MSTDTAAKTTDPSKPYFNELPEPIKNGQAQVIKADPSDRVVLITARHIPSEQSWHTKDVLATLEQDSMSWWNNQPEESQAALVVLTRDCLVRMIEDPAMWLPTSIVPRSDERLDIFINIHFAEMDEEVVRRRVETEDEMTARRDSLVGLRTELGARADADAAETDDDDVVAEG